jgi:hypothetical protein
MADTLFRRSRDSVGYPTDNIRRGVDCPMEFAIATLDRWRTAPPIFSTSRSVKESTPSTKRVAFDPGFGGAKESRITSPGLRPQATLQTGSRPTPGRFLNSGLWKAKQHTRPANFSIARTATARGPRVPPPAERPGISSAGGSDERWSHYFFSPGLQRNHGRGPARDRR